MRNSGYKTHLKEKIMDYFLKNKNVSISAKDIYSYLLENGEQINLSTVYRNLDKLVEDKTVLKYTSIDGKSATYILDSKNKSCHEHMHLQCVDCGKIIHLDCGCSEEFIEQLEENHDFELECDNAVLYGKCGECRRRELHGHK